MIIIFMSLFKPDSVQFLFGNLTVSFFCTVAFSWLKTLIIINFFKLIKITENQDVCHKFTMLLPCR